jgi:hypothetical protein
MADTEDKDKGAANMSSTAVGDRMQVKDVVVLVPILGSSLALTWEAGQFFPTGGFRLFSLSEHLLSAIAALPIALIAAVVAIVAVTFFPSSHELIQHFFGRASRPVIRRDLLIGGALLALSGISYIVAGVIFRKAGPIGGGIFIVGLAAFFISRPNPVIVYAFCFVCSLLVTLGLAIDEMRGYLNDRPGAVSTIYTKTATYRGKVILSGERGLLFFRPDQEDFVFQRQDEIQRIEWPRLKLMN